MQKLKTFAFGGINVTLVIEGSEFGPPKGPCSIVARDWSEARRR